MSRVVYNSPFVPAEWVAAHGFRPSRLVPTAAGAGSPIHATMGVCPYVRAFADAAAHAPDAAAVIFTTTCDQMRRAADWIAAEDGPHLFVMNVPSMWQTGAAHRLYRDELERLGRFLAGLGAAAPSRTRLAEVMTEYDVARHRLRAAAGRMAPRAWSAALAAFDASGSLDAVPKDNGAPAPRGVPVALLGGPMLQDDFAWFDWIERAGGRVALDATQTGERTMPRPFDRRRVPDDPLAELVDAYFGAIPDAFRRPNSELYRWLRRQIDTRDIRGLILRRYVWCDTWHVELARLREWAARPVLDIEVDGERAGSESRTAGRIEAFMESLT